MLQLERCPILTAGLLTPKQAEDSGFAQNYFKGKTDTQCVENQCPEWKGEISPCKALPLKKIH